MADNTKTQWANFLYELKGKVWQVFPTEAPFLAELSGVGDPTAVGRFTKNMDANREIFSGKWVRHTLIMAMLPGGGWTTETATWNVPQVLNTQQVQIQLADLVQPFSVSVDVERDSFDNSSAAAVETLTDQARISLARMENQAFLGDGTGLIASVTGGTSPGLTLSVGTSANFDILLPGTVWDVLTRSNGADPGAGKRRLITAVSESAGTVTFSTTAQASDGGSGNITFSANEGLYVPGSFSTAGSGPIAQGLEQAAATSGTFETLDKAANQAWQGTDGRGGDTTVLPLSDQLLDGGVRRGRRAAIGKWDFALGDPACIDLYKQGKYAQLTYNPDPLTINSGFSGVSYEGADKPFAIIKEPVHKKQGIKFIEKASFQLYGDQKGPDFLSDDGAMFRRFNRALPKEADLLDRVQLGVVKCNTIVFLNNLQQAA